MGKFIDLSGQKFGKLKVIKKIENKGENIQYLCKCDCGNYIKIIGTSLRTGNTKSCGCLAKKHGLSKHKLHKKWDEMKYRCYNDNCTHYKYYGGRGIIVCNEWLNDFKTFYDWSMAHGYADNLTIDRIDVNGNYEPSNCRWVTMEEQASNKTNNVFITYNNETHTLTEWAKILNVNYKNLWQRIVKRKWAIERAFNQPYRKSKNSMRCKHGN